jgi:hypothetical protein
MSQTFRSFDAIPICNQKLKSQAVYFAAFCFVLASARRSVFFRRLARLLALSLPLLLPISLNLRPIVVSEQWSEWDERHGRSEPDWR